MKKSTAKIFILKVAGVMITTVRTILMSITILSVGLENLLKQLSIVIDRKERSILSPLEEEQGCEDSTEEASLGSVSEHQADTEENSTTENAGS